MSEYNVVDNTELVELIERGLRKGYWDKALIPELKKRFKEIEKQENLLKLYETRIECQELYQVSDSTIERQQALECIKGIDEEIKQIKEVENDNT